MKMVLINTRPKSQTAYNYHLLNNKSIHVIDFPLLELEELSIRDNESQYQQCFVNSMNHVNFYSVLIVISPTSAQIGISNCPLGFRPDSPIVTVGNKTAKVLIDKGWEVSYPRIPNNESMIEMVAIKQLRRHDKVLIWKGVGGRSLLESHLRNKGVEVHIIEWYRRIHPQSSSINNLKQLLKSYKNSSSKTLDFNSPDTMFLIISSMTSFVHWNLLIRNSSTYKLENFVYLTLGKRITKNLVDLNLRCIPIESLEYNEIQSAIGSIEITPY